MHIDLTAWEETPPSVLHFNSLLVTPVPSENLPPSLGKVSHPNATIEEMWSPHLHMLLLHNAHAFEGHCAYHHHQTLQTGHS